jgi:hypothetical protein
MKNHQSPLFDNFMPLDGNHWRESDIKWWKIRLITVPLEMVAVNGGQVESQVN